MKISGPSSVRPSAPARRGGKSAASSSETFSVGGVERDATAAAVSDSSPLADVSALLALQEVTDATDGRARGLIRGRDLLRILEQVRLSLLSGTMPESQLARLLRLVKQRREAVSDLRLEEILREIELRAAVELAKFENHGNDRSA